MSESVIDPCSSLCESIGPNFWTKQRLETFVNWPFQSPNSQCNPERMAAAGFVAIGGNDEPDLVECFVCKKQMDGWDPDDDPWDEHVKHTTSCPYIKLNKQDEKQWTVREFFNLINEYTLSCKTQEMNNSIISLKKEMAAMIDRIPVIYKSSCSGRFSASQKK
ncbi:baculoviral IAP repeat-containing protein 5 [Cephus cinctus]|uniref:Baculoviral IAP repeat-containing protein 5 n=1 Tax=Cephus cinctus TaxID=211228 RepID=A0AAJ7FF39_CEPCN|nr:baculoviral IAP repeat-containing protein 5 [Cephus cinctus]